MTALNGKPVCFISSSVEDLPKARRIAHLFEQEDFDTITAQTSLTPGMSFIESVQSIILKADFVILLVPTQKDKKAKAWENFLLEMGMVIGMGKALLTLIEKGSDMSFPMELSSSLYLSYEPENIDSVFPYVKKLVALSLA